MQVSVAPFSIGAAKPPAADTSKPNLHQKAQSAAQPASLPTVSGAISSRAQAAIAGLGAVSTETIAPHPSATTSYFAQFFPTRDCEIASALVNGVTDPGAQSSSAGKTAKQVAIDARMRMDAVYASMAGGGKPFDLNSFKGKDWNSLMADLDRRSLNAVSINSDGLFTKLEQDIAQSLMVQQQGLAMGLYSGPIRQQGNFIDPFMGDHASRMKAGVKFLDRVSTDEKTTIVWAFARASAQISYEVNAAEDGAVPENLESDDPTVQLIKAAMMTMRESMERNITTGPVRTTDELKTQPWFKGFESQLE